MILLQQLDVFEVAFEHRAKLRRIVLAGVKWIRYTALFRVVAAIGRRDQEHSFATGLTRRFLQNISGRSKCSITSKATIKSKVSLKSSISVQSDCLNCKLDAW